MAHTQGPWHQPMRYSPEDGCDIPCGAIEAAGERIIVASFVDVTAKEWAANAKLITAAPDLLAACQMAADLMENLTTGEFLVGADTVVCRTLRAAIAKATA